MPPRRRVIYFIGSSHAANLKIHAEKLFSYKEFKILEYSKRGSTFFDLFSSLPDPTTFSEEEIIIFNSLGNGTFHRTFEDKSKNVYPTVETNRQGKRIKTIHMKSFLPRDPSSIQKEQELVLEYLSKCKAKIILFDNIVRHCFCCKEHKDKQRFKFQVKQNFELRKFFQSQNLPNLIVLDHRTVLPGKKKLYRRAKAYKKVLSDSVHLTIAVYRFVLEKLLCRLKLRDNRDHFSDGCRFEPVSEVSNTHRLKRRKIYRAKRKNKGLK